MTIRAILFLLPLLTGCIHAPDAVYFGASRDVNGGPYNVNATLSFPITYGQTK